ncbi:hypothetical protein [Amycolatopsis sp. NPDC051903]|uniref:hypothetical protein n=1 Tax=Amycolatopsis sp. NPDC051903 TaxID=3363936 RepID=UPI0037B83308
MPTGTFRWPCCRPRWRASYLTGLSGSARIMQLRATARKHRRADRRAVKAEAKDSSKARR